MRKPQIVITLPGANASHLTNELRARTTLGALTTIIAQARKHLVIAAPFVQADAALNQEPLSGALKAALERGVSVEIASTLRGLDSLDRAELSRIARNHVTFFHASEKYPDASAIGFHAKFCVADGQMAYVGSANLTRPGLEQHFEMGVLVYDETALQVLNTWHYLVGKGFFREIA